ncbi:MAG: DUF2723 domain-containing protein [Chloroflexi bacterium]|nr:DUF2723 domain-containing protein [Chloroflexota bacterium]
MASPKRTKIRPSTASPLSYAEQPAVPGKLRGAALPRDLPLGLAGHATALTVAFFAISSFALYWVSLQPGLMGGDPAEAQFVPYLLGIAHYTGYPLYTLLGKLWTLLIPFGTIPYRMNLLSAVAAAVAVGAVAWLGQRLGRHWLAGLAAALLLACSPLFWDWATKAGGRSLNAAFVATILVLVLRLVDHQTEIEGNSVGAVFNRTLFGLGPTDTTVPSFPSLARWSLLWFVTGLSLAHHRTSLLLLPGAILYLLWAFPTLRRNWRPWVWAALLTLPGLALYLYLPWRSAQHPIYEFLRVDSLDHFLDLALARGLNSMVTSVTWAQIPVRLGWFVEFLRGQFGAIGCLLGCAGLVWLTFRRPQAGLLLWLSLILVTAFTINYNIEGERLNVVFLLPVQIIFALGIGLTLAALPTIAGALFPGHFWPTAATFVALLLLVYLAGRLVPTSLQLVYPPGELPLDAYRTELRRNQAARLVTFAEPLAAPAPVIVGEWEHAAAFWYRQLVDGHWPGAEFRYPVDANLDQYIHEAWDHNREIYLTRALPGLGERYPLTMAGPLIHILRQPETALPCADCAPPPVPAGTKLVPLDQPLEEGLTLLAYQSWGGKDAPSQPGGVLPIELYWQSHQLLTQDYSVSLRLLDAQGQQVAAVDNQHPVLGSYPTSRWVAGATVGDYYELPLDPHLSPGTYALAVVIYTRLPDGSFRNLHSLKSGADLVPFASITLEPRP